MSRHWRGFRLFDEPSYMFGFGNAHLCMPWEVWGVKPTRLLRYEATAVADFAGASFVHATSKWCSSCHQASSSGPMVGQSADSSRSSPRSHSGHQPSTRGNPDYEIAMTFLED